ncbi:MAG TPA: hypothetical protein VFL57_18255 [Bryobacteraceae bacterium]|nr:hypothetical protein [Bryobacteraceae bacterium]
MQKKHGIIVDFDKNGVDDFKQGLDFNSIKSAFDVYKPNAPVLGYSAASGYTIRIGRVEYQVAFVHGGSGLYKQRFLVRMPVTDTDTGMSAGTYYSPIQFNESTQSYVVYEPKYWYNADNSPKFTGPITAREAAGGKSFDKGCSGCHSTVLTSVGKDSNGEYISSTPTPVYVREGDVHYLDLRGRGDFDLYNIGCERCHGPGASHVIARGAPAKIVNPARDFTAKQQNFQCGSCHSRGYSMPSATHEFPYDEATGEEYARFNPTEDLFTRFLQNKPGLYPDNKTSRQHHQQLQDLMKSPKWEFAYHKVTCVECHDPHRATKSQIRTSLVTTGAGNAKLTLAVNVNDNSLCLGCHAGFGPFKSLTREQIADVKSNRELIAQVVTAHTRHPYNPEGAFGVSRCTTCHMAQMAASGAPFDMHSHTFEVVPPEKTLSYQAQGGMPNSCATCHRQMAALIGAPADTSLTAWNEESDVAVAKWLMKYYGPDGTWWKTKPEESK